MHIYIHGFCYLSVILCAVLTDRATASSEESTDSFEIFTDKLALLVAEAFHHKNHAVEEQSLLQLSDTSRSCEATGQAAETQSTTDRRLLICQVMSHAESLMGPSPYADTMKIITTLKTEHIDRFKDVFESLKVAAGDSKAKTTDYTALLNKLVGNWAKWKDAADAFEKNNKVETPPAIPMWEEDPDNNRLELEMQKNDVLISKAEADMLDLKGERSEEEKQQGGDLCIHVEKATDLVSSDPAAYRLVGQHKPDAFVTVKEAGKEWKTTQKDNNDNPVWDEEHCFSVTECTMMSMNIHDYDMWFTRMWKGNEGHDMLHTEEIDYCERAKFKSYDGAWKDFVTPVARGGEFSFKLKFTPKS